LGIFELVFNSEKTTSDGRNKDLRERELEGADLFIKVNIRVKIRSNGESKRGGIGIGCIDSV
jgi:hypothetical protein